MSGVERVSISLEKPLLERLERLVREGNYSNRSEYIRDLIRDKLVEKEWDRDEEAVGTVTFIYNHHTRGLTDRLTHVQHDYHDVILATMHIHLDHDLCAETVVVRGRGKQIDRLANMLRQQKGVLHASLSISSTGKNLA
ncbi:MAG TPA: nickel-responsive transcriptional regulator NikR [Candidatus Hydrogenedentes bacterium]|nr:nickel-responsive transcriptional regulator NikR [Candidatus Hydrogenedentota bacterium]